MTDRGRYWRDLVRAWKLSGLSQAAFCRERDLKPVTFGWWKRKLVGTARTRRPPGRSRKPRTGQRGLASGNSARAMIGTTGFVEMKLDHSGGNGPEAVPLAAYEVVLPGGATIRLPRDFDPDRITRLVLALQSSC